MNEYVYLCPWLISGILCISRWYWWKEGIECRFGLASWLVFFRVYIKNSKGIYLECMLNFGVFHDHWSQCWNSNIQSNLPHHRHYRVIIIDPRFQQMTILLLSHCLEWSKVLKRQKKQTWLDSFHQSLMLIFAVQCLNSIVLYLTYYWQRDKMLMMGCYVNPDRNSDDDFHHFIHSSQLSP